MGKLILSLFLFTTIIFRLSGQNVAEVRLSYTSLNKKLPVVLQDLTIFSGVNIVFSDTKLKSTRKVTFSAKNERLGDILNVILKPYGFDFEIVGQNIVIINKRESIYKENYKLQGYIKDKTSGEVLPYAAIYSIDKSWGITANENGFFSLNMQRGEKVFCVAYLGFETDTIAQYFTQSQVLDVNLEPNSFLNEITIVDDGQYSERENPKYLSKRTMSEDAYLGGEADIMHHLQNQAGVTTNADGFGGLHVRGGSYDQNLILLDGVPIQHTGHAFGILSIFNNNAIQDARFYKGSFPARYGGKISSILDIRTREGNNQKYAGEVSLSTLAASLSIEGPIIKDKASFIISARRTFADTWIKAISKFQNDPDKGFDGFTTFKFYDLNAKFTFDLTRQHSLSVNYYQGSDDLNSFQNYTNPFAVTPTYVSQTKDDWNWGNKLYSVVLNSQLNKNSFSRVSLFNTEWNYSKFNFNRFGSISDSTSTDIYESSLKASRINNQGIIWDVDMQLSNPNRLRFGASYTRQKYSPSYKQLSNSDTLLMYPNQIHEFEIESQLVTNVSEPREINVHIEDEIKFNGGFALRGGVMFSNYSVDTFSGISIQPRIVMSQTGETMRFEIGASKMRQYGQVLSEEGLGFPSDVWVTASGRLKPADAWIINTNTVFQVNKEVVISFGGYLKFMENLISLNEGEAIPFDKLGEWDKFIPRGKGKAYGIEISCSKILGDTRFDFNYTWSKSLRNFADLNNGKEFDYRTSRSHSFNFSLKQKIGKNIELISNVAVYSGTRATFPEGDIVEYTDSKGVKRLSIVYLEKNNYVFPFYQRVDIGFNFYTKYNWGRQKIFIGFYNVTNQKNPLYLDVKRNELDPQFYEVRQISLIPFLPALSYSLAF